jgi:hypothetical protein
MSLAPADIPGSANHPDSTLDGFKAVGIFKGRLDWVIKKTIAALALASHLANLDIIDDLADTEQHRNVVQLRRTLINNCVGAQSKYH